MSLRTRKLSHFSIYGKDDAHLLIFYEYKCAGIRTTAEFHPVLWADKKQVYKSSAQNKYNNRLKQNTHTSHTDLLDIYVIEFLSQTLSLFKMEQLSQSLIFSGS